MRRTQTVGVPHDTLSEMVVACVVPSDGIRLDEHALVAHLKEVRFFADSDFSLTGNEKVKVEGIRQLAAQRLGVVYVTQD